MVFIVMFGGEPFAITKIALTDLENITIYFVIVMMISTVFNAIMYFLMSKGKDIDEKFSFKVNKIKYLLTSYFLGYCGIHRFIAKDKQGGKFRLILIGTVGLTFFIAIAFQFDIMMYLGIMMLACVLGLDTSDFVIALTKKADNEGNIFV